jgi:hypothetical protein
MAQKYYNLREASRVLGVGEEEIKEMLQRKELYGLRDGADWKFKVEDIERLARDRARSVPTPESEEADVLLSEHELGESGPGASGTVIGMGGAERPTSESDLRLADSDISATTTRAEQPSRPAGKPMADGGTKHDDLDLTLDSAPTLDIAEEAAISRRSASPSDSTLDIAADTEGESVLEGSGPGSDITLGSDSGISLVDAADSGLSLEAPIGLGADESLELGEEDMLGDEGMAPAGEDDFLLQPSPEPHDADESESGSQVIALVDAEADDGATMVASPRLAAVGITDEDLGVYQRGLPPAPDITGETTTAPTPAAETVAWSEALPEPPYSALQITGLVACALMLVVCGMFAFDLLRNMWMWESPYTFNSWMIETVLGAIDSIIGN